MGIQVGPAPIDEEAQHRAIVRIPPMAIRRLLMNGMTTRCLSGIPDDAKFITVYYDIHTMCFLAVFEHPSFDRICEGCQLPVLKVEFEFVPLLGETYVYER